MRTRSWVDAVRSDDSARWTLGIVAIIVVLFALRFMEVPVLPMTVVVIAVAATVSLGVPIGWRVATGFLAWAVLDGFIFSYVNEPPPMSTDFQRLALFLAATLLAGVIARPRASRT